MSKFVLPALNKKPSTNPRGEVVRIGTDAYNLLVEMSNESPLPMGKIASMAIEYAYGNLSYEKEKGGD